MDWASLIFAAIAGGVSAGLGALIVKMVGISNTMARTVIIVALFAIGSQVIPPVLNQFVGAEIRDATGSTAQAEREIDAVWDQPIFAAIEKDDPAAAEAIRTQLVDAYRRGGTDALQAEASRMGSTYIAPLFAKYAPKARDEDLLAFAEAYIAIADVLNDQAPAVCYDWVTGNPSFDQQRFNRVAGQDKLMAIGNAMGAVIQNAYETAPEINTAELQILLQGIMQSLLLTHSADILPVATGQVPAQTDEQKQQACALTRDLYKAVAAHERGGALLRMMFGG